MRTRPRIPFLAALLSAMAVACDSTTEPSLLSVPAVTLEAVGDSRQLVASIRGDDRLPTWESLNPASRRSRAPVWSRPSRPARRSYALDSGPRPRTAR